MAAADHGNPVGWGEGAESLWRAEMGMPVDGISVNAVLPEQSRHHAAGRAAEGGVTDIGHGLQQDGEVGLLKREGEGGDPGSVTGCQDGDPA